MPDQPGTPSRSSGHDGAAPASPNAPSEATFLDPAVSALHRSAPHLDATGIAEVLWLAARMGASSASGDTPSAQAPQQGSEAASSSVEDAAVDSPAQLKAPPPTPLTSPVSIPVGRTLHERLPGADTTVRGHAVSTPRAAALPGALELSQALRPWKKLWRAGRRKALDVTATVDSYAQSGELIPFFTAAPERWFDLDLLVDQSPSMQIWGETIDAFIKVLDQLGAFRTLRVHRLTFTDDSRIELYNQQGQPTSAGELRSPNSRRLVVMISDCAARAWREPAPWQQLREWSQNTPLAFLNPLPTKLWRRTGLSLPMVRVCPGPPGANNSTLSFELPPLLSSGKNTAQDTWVPIPVLSLSPNSLNRWSRTVMLGSPVGCAAALIPRTGRVTRRSHPNTVTRRPPKSARERVDDFLRTSSPEAGQLAVLCSPFDRLGLGLLHLVRQELVPQASTEDVAEVLTSGVFALDTDQSGSVELTVPQPVQARLREELAEHELWKMHRSLSRYIASHTNGQGRLAAVARGADAPEDLPAALTPFGHASQRTLELLGLSASSPETAVQDSSTTIIPGQLTTRADMKRLFGGGPQGGIIPSSTTPNILIYSDHTAGQRYGYYDGWLPEDDAHGSLFEYTGAGTLGDQTFSGQKGANNKAILQHAERGRALRIFMADGKVPGSGTKYQRYVGEFTLDATRPYITRQAPDDNGELRNVIVFRLRPSGDVVRDPRDEIPPAAAVVRETALLDDRLAAYLQQRGHTVQRNRVELEDGSSLEEIDLYDATDQVLYDVKHSTQRELVTKAVERLLGFRDRSRSLNLAIVLPSEPSDAVKQYLRVHAIALVYPDGDAFVGDILGK
ncbi:SAV_2336 N-terminal domain-related protein [Streptomyces platensis]|uniref:SAV_2336 N-terminal domain-related protein n=1 Tax=Streptomyces platensis TaxID=58346 RepID=UPI0036A4179C